MVFETWDLRWRFLAAGDFYLATDYTDCTEFFRVWGCVMRISYAVV